MVTREDVKTVSTDISDIDGSIWHYVEAKDQRFILVATDMNEDDIVRTMEFDILLGLALMTGQYPTADTAVFRGDKDWQIVGECGPECGENGVCSRRVANRDGVGDINLAYNMLLDYLNA